MKQIFLSLVAALPLLANAQSIARYTAEGKDYIEASGCTPGSSASFYSTIHGGRLLARYPADGGCKAIIPATKDFQPQMLLNDGPNGTKHVAYTGPREFLISTPEATQSGSAAMIHWEGAAAMPEDITFSIFRSTDGATWQPVAAVPARPGDDARRYTATDEGRSRAATLYKVAVQSKTAGLRYTTRPVMLAAATGITVFPTIATDALYIAIPAVADGAAYTIVGSNGARLSGGPLSATQSVIPVGSLLSGNYLVKVQCGIVTTATKVIKQ